MQFLSLSMCHNDSSQTKIFNHIIEPVMKCKYSTSLRRQKYFVATLILVNCCFRPIEIFDREAVLLLLC